MRDTHTAARRVCKKHWHAIGDRDRADHIRCVGKRSVGGVSIHVRLARIDHRSAVYLGQPARIRPAKLPAAERDSPLRRQRSSPLASPMFIPPRSPAGTPYGPRDTPPARVVIKCGCTFAGAGHSGRIHCGFMSCSNTSLGTSSGPEAKVTHQSREIRCGTLKPRQPPSAGRMIETQLACVQRLPIECRPAWPLPAAWRQSAPIQRITNQRMAKMLEVHANLMRSTRFQPAREPRNFGRRHTGRIDPCVMRAGRLRGFGRADS